MSTPRPAFASHFPRFGVTFLFQVSASTSRNPLKTKESLFKLKTSA